MNFHDRFTTDQNINPATEEKQDDIIAAIGVAGTLSGASVNGTTALTSADTWYQVPTSSPASDFILVVTLENAVGDIRWAFTNSTTPSTTNGLIAPGELQVKLAAGEVIYYGSSTAGDDVNFTTKII